MANEYSSATLLLPILLPSSSIQIVQDNVVVNGVQVEADSEIVSVTYSTQYYSQERLVYLTHLVDDGVNFIGFSEKKQDTFYDWSDTLVGGGVDSPGYMVCGYVPEGDYQRNKSINYVTFHLKRTDDVEVEGVYQTSSSCVVATAWDWSNDYYKGSGGFGNNWSKPFQAYRYKRRNNVDPHDWSLGETVISTRSRVRGSGKVFSFNISTEPGKDCQLQGWSLIISGNGNV